MNVSELFDLTRWIVAEVTEKQIVQKYSALHQALHQAAQPNQPTAAFEGQREDLLATVRAVPLNQLTRDQLTFLNDLGIGKALGPDGAAKVEDILYRNVIDVATSAAKVKEIHDELNRGVSKSNQIRQGLSGVVSEEPYEIDDEVLIRVCFRGNAAMSNIVDLKKWGNTWHEIGRGIALAHDATPEDIRVVGATNGSVVIEMATLATLAGSTSMILLAALKVAEKVLDVAKKVEEWRGLKLKNKKLAGEMEKEVENTRSEGLEQITATMIKELGLKKNAADGEKIEALDRSIKSLVAFVESGGEVDFVIPDAPDDEDSDAQPPEYDQLRVRFAEIRTLEAKIRLIESTDDAGNAETKESE